MPLKPRSNDPEQLLRIRQHGQALRVFVEGVTEEQFLGDLEKQYAVGMAVYAIIEGIYMLTKELKDANPVVPYRDVVDLRHLYAHDYAEVHPVICWRIATRQVLPWLDSLEPLLPSLQEP